MPVGPRPAQMRALARCGLHGVRVLRQHRVEAPSHSGASLTGRVAGHRPGRGRPPSSTRGQLSWTQPREATAQRPPGTRERLVVQRAGPGVVEDRRMPPAFCRGRAPRPRLVDSCRAPGRRGTAPRASARCAAGVGAPPDGRRPAASRPGRDNAPRPCPGPRRAPSWGVPAPRPGPPAGPRRIAAAWELRLGPPACPQAASAAANIAARAAAAAQRPRSPVAARLTAGLRPRHSCPRPSGRRPSGRIPAAAPQSSLSRRTMADVDVERRVVLVPAAIDGHRREIDAQAAIQLPLGVTRGDCGNDLRARSRSTPPPKRAASGRPRHVAVAEGAQRGQRRPAVRLAAQLHHRRGQEAAAAISAPAVAAPAVPDPVGAAGVPGGARSVGVGTAAAVATRPARAAVRARRGRRDPVRRDPAPAPPHSRRSPPSRGRRSSASPAPRPRGSGWTATSPCARSRCCPCSRPGSSRSSSPRARSPRSQARAGAAGRPRSSSSSRRTRARPASLPPRSPSAAGATPRALPCAGCAAGPRPSGRPACSAPSGCSLPAEVDQDLPGPFDRLAHRLAPAVLGPRHLAHQRAALAVRAGRAGLLAPLASHPLRRVQEDRGATVAPRPRTARSG